MRPKTLPMLSRQLLLVFFTLSLSLSAQQNPSPEEANAPWLFLEGRVSWGFAEVMTGTEYTTAENQSSQAVRLLARRTLGQHLGIGVGLGLGTRSFRLASTYDRYVRQTFPPNTPGEEIDWTNRLAYSDVYVELPLELSLEVLRLGPGMLYLQAGSIWFVPVLTGNENYRVYDNRPQPALMPDARVEYTVTHLLSAGIGFRTKNSSRYDWHVALLYDRPTSDAVRPVAPAEQDPRSRHLPRLRARQLGIVFGVAL